MIKLEITDMIRNSYMKTIVSVIAFLITFSMTSNFLAEAGPASGKTVILRQPDGSFFEAKLSGDEFLKLYTTIDGQPVSQDKDGYYHIDNDILALHRLHSASRNKRRLLESVTPGKGILKRVQENSPEMKGPDTPITKHAIIILAEFADTRFKYSQEDFIKLLTQPGYNINGADGSAMDYFNDQFKGKFKFAFDISEIVHLSHDCAYYGSNLPDGSDKAAAEMIVEACTLADNTVDFSKYDDDGDGEVDNVFVFFSGADEAEGAGTEKIWSHAWYVSLDGHNIRLDGKKIDRYACTAELSILNGNKLAGIGTFCHEFSHTLGLDDYYDTDYEGSGGLSKALWGSTSLMDAGNTNNKGKTPPNYNAIDREMSGISSAETLKPGRYTLEPIDVNGRYLRIDTERKGEYFLIECRFQHNWDTYSGGRGMLVYHIDKSDANTGYSEIYGKDLKAWERWTMNEINCRPDHQCADLIEAESAATDISRIFFPSPLSSPDEFTPESGPAFRSWSNTASPLSITDIRISENGVTFTVTESDSKPSQIKITRKEIYQDAIILCWEMPDTYTETTVSVKEGDVTVHESTVTPYSPGMYSFTLEKLTPGVNYMLRLSSGDTSGNTSEFTERFTTKPVRINKIPFIYLSYTERNADGTFPSGSKLPLRLFNATDAETVLWYMNDEEVKTDGSGYYIPSTSGTLKAEIIYKDGSRAFVCKKINIR